ncbi:hypothetical protein ACEPAG_4801 [Sanghuangporus baumii]
MQSEVPHKSKKLKASTSPTLPVVNPVNSELSQEQWQTVGRKGEKSLVRIKLFVSKPSRANRRQSRRRRSVVESRKDEGQEGSKNEEKAESTPPRFFYVNSEITKRREAITIGDIRDLVLHLLGEAAPQSWLKVENRQAISKVVVLFVPGILPEHLNVKVHLANATANPSIPLTIPLPPDPTLPTQRELVAVRTLFGGIKEIIPDMRTSAIVKLPFLARTFGRACPTHEPGDSFHVSVDLEAGSSSMTEDGWTETPRPEDDESGTVEVVAVDCEMCLTEDGKELTRICAIDFSSGNVLLDQLVKPQKPVLDYLTRWSGIKEESLRDITATLQTARDELLDLLHRAAELLAHSRCIDTALLYHHPRGRPLKPRLAWLTKKWCGREIQNRGEGGHDAEEDARACIELLPRKLKGGPSFVEYKSTTEFESIFERLKRSIRGSPSGEPGTGAGSKLRTAVVGCGNPATWHGILKCMEDSNFIWARLSGLAEAQNWLQQKPTVDNPIQTVTETAFENAIRALQTNSNSPLNAASVSEGVRWTNADARELEEAVERARKGLLFLSLK